MKKIFTTCTLDGEVARKKIEKLFLKAGFIKTSDRIFYGEECDVLPIAEQLDKENIYYAICPISLFYDMAESQKAVTELPF